MENTDNLEEDQKGQDDGNADNDDERPKTPEMPDIDLHRPPLAQSSPIKSSPSFDFEVDDAEGFDDFEKRKECGRKEDLNKAFNRGNEQDCEGAFNMENVQYPIPVYPEDGDETQTYDDDYISDDPERTRSYPNSDDEDNDADQGDEEDNIQSISNVDNDE